MKKEIALSFLLTLFVLVLNVFLRTMVNISNDSITGSYYLHQSVYPFLLRPFTSMTMFYLNEINFSFYAGFVFHQYLLLFATFVSFTILLKEFRFTDRERILGLWITALSFPVLCIHFIPVYSWDDIWAYLSVIWMFYFIKKNNLYLASILFFFSLVSRESLVLLFPLFFFFRDTSKSPISWLLPMLLPILLYSGIRISFFPGLLEGRFTRLPVNLEDANAIRQSIYSLFISFGWMWAFLLIPNKNQSAEEKKLYYSALVVSLLTIVVVLNTALVREVRLLFTPFVVLIPLAIMRFRQIIPKLKHYLTIQYMSRVLLLFIICVILTVMLFPSFSYLPMIDFHRVLFALHLTGFIIVFFVIRKVNQTE